MVARLGALLKDEAAGRITKTENFYLGGVRGRYGACARWAGELGGGTSGSGLNGTGRLFLFVCGSPAIAVSLLLSSVACFVPERVN